VYCLLEFEGRKMKLDVADAFEMLDKHLVVYMVLLSRKLEKHGIPSQVQSVPYNICVRITVET
jgi:hypothetical protein